MPYPICTLLVLLLSSCTAHATPVVLFTYQSQYIPYDTWFQYLTLCLAPLIAHVVAGVVPPVVIPSHSKPPSWSAYLPHFNPISIAWRWYAIADRRARACSWDAADMAACNAVIWDSKRARWDGSEDIMLRSRAWIIKVPDNKHVSYLSPSSFATLVLTLQGAHACFIIFQSLNTKTTYHFGQGLPNAFIPIAIMGLFRLPAALWLSDDYAYMDEPHSGNGSERNGTEAPVATMEEADDSHFELGARDSKQATRTADLSLLSIGPSHLSELTATDKPRLHSTRTPVARIYRIWWFLSVNGLLVGAAVSTTHTLWGYQRSFPYIALSHLLSSTLYFILSSSTVLIMSTYILWGHTNTTIIPCIHAMWYKMLTLVLAALGLVMMVVAALETRQLHNGKVTTLPEFRCNTTAGLCLPVSRGQGNFNV